MTDKQKQTIFKIIKSIMVFFLFYYRSIFLLIPINLFHIDLSSINGTMEVILNTYVSITMVLILFLLYRKDLKKEFITFKNNLLENIDTGFKYWFLGLVIMIISNLILVIVFKSSGANNENAVQEMIKNLPFLMVINASFLAPFNEEIIFRKTIKDVVKNKWVFVLLSFLLFGGAHVIGNVSSYVDLLYIIPYGALGAAFALAYYKTDTIYTSMLFHILHNFILTLVSIL